MHPCRIEHRIEGDPPWQYRKTKFTARRSWTTQPRAAVSRGLREWRFSYPIPRSAISATSASSRSISAWPSADWIASSSLRTTASSRLVRLRESAAAAASSTFPTRQNCAPSLKRWMMRCPTWAVHRVFWTVSPARTRRRITATRRSIRSDKTHTAPTPVFTVRTVTISSRPSAA